MQIAHGAPLWAAACSGEIGFPIQGIAPGGTGTSMVAARCVPNPSLALLPGLYAEVDLRLDLILSVTNSQHVSGFAINQILT